MTCHWIFILLQWTIKKPLVIFFWCYTFFNLSFCFKFLQVCAVLVGDLNLQVHICVLCPGKYCFVFLRVIAQVIEEQIGEFIIGTYGICWHISYVINMCHYNVADQTPCWAHQSYHRLAISSILMAWFGLKEWVHYYLVIDLIFSFILHVYIGHVN